MLVLVDQPAEDPATSYVPGSGIGDGGRGAFASARWPQVPGSVRAMLVVVRGVAVQDGAQVPSPGNEPDGRDERTDLLLHPRVVS